jgi:hypothetical protein
MSLVRPPSRSVDRIRDIGTSAEEQERSALDAFLELFDFSDGGPFGGVSNEFPGQTWTPPSREGSFASGFLPAVAPTPATTTTTTTPPAASTDDGILNDLLGGAKDATTAVAGVIDTGLKQLGELIGMGDPSLVVLNPTNPNATVVFGTPQGNTTPTIIGNMPKSGAPVGVITGIPALDDILVGVFNKRGQGGKSIPEIIYDVVFDQIGKETGYPAAGVAGAIGGGLSGDLNKVIEDINKVVLQIDKKVKDADSDPIRIINNPDAYRGDPVGPVQITPDIPTGEDVLIGGGGDTKSKENKVTPPPPPPPPPIPEPPLEEILTILGETPEPGKVTPTPLRTTVPVPVPSIPTTLYGQGIRSMKTEKAGVTPLEDVFDIGSMSLANVLRLLAGEDDNTQGTPYYGGGSVNKNSSVDELIRLLRG